MCVLCVREQTMEIYRLQASLSCGGGIYIYKNTTKIMLVYKNNIQQKIQFTLLMCALHYHIHSDNKKEKQNLLQ